MIEGSRGWSTDGSMSIQRVRAHEVFLIIFIFIIIPIGLLSFLGVGVTRDVGWG
jgi:hypothetical protein